MYAVLPSRMNSLAPLVSMHDQVTREAGCVGLVGRYWGRRALSDVVPVYLNCPAFSVSVSLGV